MQQRILYLVAVLCFCALNGFADEVEVLIKGVDDGVKTTKQQDYAEALMNAKLQAIERAGVEVSSITRIENFKLKFDTVESKAKAVLLPGFQVMDMGYQQDGTYQVVLSGKVQAGAKETKLAVGDETMLAAVVADPRQYVNKPIIVVGMVRGSDSYGDGYENAAGTHYCLMFGQVISYKPGEGVRPNGLLYIFADRRLAKPLIDAIGEAQRDGKDVKVVRLKVAVTSRSFTDYEGKGTWEFKKQAELIDWQFRTKDNSDWSTWAISGKTN